MVYDPKKLSEKNLWDYAWKGLVTNQPNHWSIAGVSTCYTSQDPTAGTQKWWVWCRWVSFWVKILQSKLTYPPSKGIFKSMIFLFPFGGICSRILGLRQKQIWWCPCVLLAFRRETSGTFVQQKSRKGFPMEWLLGFKPAFDGKMIQNTEFDQEHEPFMMPQVVIFTRYLQDKWYSWALGMLQNQHSPPSLRDFFGRLLNWSKITHVFIW